MKRFKSLAHQPTLTIVDLPRQSWRLLPPRRWQVVVTLAGIIITAVMWAVL
jgi:hypothetical protein